MQDVICFDRIDRHLIQGASVALGGKVNPGQGVPAAQQRNDNSLTNA